jgi:OmpA family
MKSHRYKPAHYGVSFSTDKVIKESQGSLLSSPDIFFGFTDDDSFVEIQAVVSFDKPVRYVYFGMFREDSARVPKKFIPVSHEISYTDTAAYWQYVKATRIMLDNILIGKLDTMDKAYRDIYFRHDDDMITAQKDIALVRAIAKEMKAHPDTYLLIQGYADPSGTYLYNLDLSARRAAHVKEILPDQHIEEHRIVTIGKGVFPAGDDGRDPGYARKVSFLLLKS